MEGSSKKRSRKSKLVPRAYSDSDDENIALMQKEIELELANIKAQSILKKLSASSLSNQKDFQFSVKVEVEPCDDESEDSDKNTDLTIVTADTADSGENSPVKPTSVEVIPSTSTANIQTEAEDVVYIKEEKADILEVEDSSDSKTDENTKISDNSDEEDDGEKSPVNKSGIRVESVMSLAVSNNVNDGYKITEKMIYDEFQIVSKKATSYADKLLGIRMRNYIERDVTGAFPEGETEEGIQEALKKWKSWQYSYPTVRGPPLMYICSKCKIGFWHLYDFREHVKDHANINIKFFCEEHLSYIIAHLSNKADKLVLSVDSDCWRCGKGLKGHNDVIYKCNYCNRYFETCLLMSIHEGVCEEYKRNSPNSEYTHAQRKCPVCPYKHWRKEDLQRHILGMHLVRSDVPMPWSSKTCSKCNVMYNHHTLHECRGKPAVHPCMFCSRRFQNKHNVSLHYWMTPNDFECRICKKVLKKECMEREHLLNHSDSYRFVYKCIACEDTPCFLDKKSQIKHKYSAHKRIRRTLFEKVIVPKTLIKKLRNKRRNKRDKFIGVPNVEMDTPRTTTTDVIIESNITVNAVDSNHTISPNLYNIESNKDTQNTIQIKQEIVEEVDDKALIPEDYSREKTKRKAENETENNLEIKKMANLEVTKIKEEPVDDEIDEANEFNDMQEDGEVNDTKEDGEVSDMNEDSEVNDTNENSEANDTNENSEANDVTENSESNDMNENDEFNDMNEDYEFNDDDDEVNDELNSMFEMEICDLPIKFEIKDELDDSSENNTMDSGVSLQIIGKKETSRSRSKTQLKAYSSNGHNIKRLGGERYLKMIHNNKHFYRCTKCNNLYRTFHKYLQHFMVQHDYEPMTCPQCNMELKNSDLLANHVNMHIKCNFVVVHSIKNTKGDCTFQCKKCQKVLVVSEFFMHWEMHLCLQELTNLQETSCAVNMDGKPNLKKMIMHIQQGGKHPSKTKVCIECKKTFVRNNDYKRHFIEHLLTDAYSEQAKYGSLKCQICGAGFQGGDRYKRHLRDHASLPVYKCEMCDKAFSDSSNFSKHKKVHNLSVLICAICGKKFQNKMYMIKHLEEHSTTKPIDCDHCHRLFYSRSSYLRHLKKTKPKYKCQICLAAFNTVKERWDHMWEVHKKRNCKADCPICHTSFRKISDVKKHIREEHGDYCIVSSRL